MLLYPAAVFFQFFHLGCIICSSTSLRESTDPSHNAIQYICLGAKLSTTSIYPQVSNSPVKRDQVQRAKDVHWLFTPTFSFGIPGFFNHYSEDKNEIPVLDSSPLFLSPSVCSAAGYSGQQRDAASTVDNSGPSDWHHISSDLFLYSLQSKCDIPSFSCPICICLRFVSSIV
jgi:hypothetical protein